MERKTIRNLQIEISTFNTCRDNRPKKYVGTVENLFRPHVVSNAKDGPAFSFALYKEGTTRSNKNVTAITGVGFDLDDSSPDEIQKILRVFESSELARVVHTTFSHRLNGKGDRIRIICFFSREASVVEYQKIWSHFQVLCNNAFDEAAKDSSRLLYLPRVSPEVQQFAAIKYFDGDLIDIDHLINEPTPIPLDNRQQMKKMGRNSTLASLAGKLRSQGVDEETLERSLLSLNENLFESPLDEAEVKSVSSSISKYEKKTSKKDDLFGKAEHYLASLVGRLVLLDSTYYQYTGSHYEEISSNFLKCQLVKFLQSEGGNVTPEVVNTILLNIAGICCERVDVIPSYLNSIKPQSGILVLSNGLLDIRKAMQGSADALFPFSDDYFALGATDYPFDPNAKCPIWLHEYLDVIQPDKEMQSFLQEVLGYSLLSDFNLGKFFLLIGEGANGKSVFVTVLQKLVGVTNASGVSLESMSLTRTFPLWGLLGKLVNVAEEIGEIEKAEEGLLKNIVTGGRVSIERKYRDPVSTSLSAKLFFCTNSPPRFKDRSSGLWRRMLPVPFTIQILDEAKQNKNFVLGDWWKDSGELPGILNWALEGLKRLSERGHFSIPSQCKKFLSEYRFDSNPAVVFLTECCAELSDGKISTHDLYQKYTVWCRDNGFSPLNATGFTREVKKFFPKISRTDNALRGQFARSRVWEGISYLAN